METITRGDVPKTLHTIAYISIPNSADLGFLLWDLHDAIAAYARFSGTALPRPVDLKANDTGSVADGIVLAMAGLSALIAVSPLRQSARQPSPPVHRTGDWKSMPVTGIVWRSR